MFRIKRQFIKTINHKRKVCHDHDVLVFSYKSCLKYSKRLAADYINVSFASKYDSKTVEKNKYKKWELSGLFSPKSSIADHHPKPFTMILPPPNITGTLHLGHALTIAIQDILCRWKRMQGYSVLWVPGIDHAGIATQVMVENTVMKQKGLKLRDMKQEEFHEELTNWKREKEDKIKDQIKQLGASVDWSRYTFTMDSKQSEIVRDALIELFDEGLIQKKNSLVNWCCSLQSVISDIEVEKIPVKGCTFFTIPGYKNDVKFGTMTEFAYKVVDSDSEVIVATTRLETVCGDVAVIVNPEDERYSHLKDKFVWHPFRKCQIPIIFDKSAIPDFGTGAFKVTPAHSRIDFELAQIYNLPVVTVIAENGTLNENCGDWANIPRFLARDLIQKKLNDLGLLRNVKEHETTIPFCSRSGDVVEQFPKSQWFLTCSRFYQQILKILENELDIQPIGMKQFIKNWMESDQDWCLSRQIRWGHRLPFYETEYGWIAAKSIEEAREKANKKFSQMCNEIKQDTDVLDTWFSSAILPFSVFGWPNMANKDYKMYYPLSIMETGRDISCLWVARMIMIGLQFTDKLPFNKIVLHGMICDAYGRKMSKSLGNVIELNHVIDGISLKDLNDNVYSNHKKGILSENELQNALSIQQSIFPNGIPACGADALRFSLVSQDILHPFIIFNIEECKRASHFCNKMWQAFRFSVTWANKFMVTIDTPLNPILPWHYWLLHKMAFAVEIANNGLKEMDFNLTTKTLKYFFINDLCDFYLEVSKPFFHGNDENQAKATCSVLIFCLETYMRLIAPIMPFISEDLYSYLPEVKKELTNTKYPQTEEYEKWKNKELDEEISFIRNVIRCIRGLQAEVRNSNEIVIITEKKCILERYQILIQNLVKSPIKFDNEFEEPAIGNTVDNHTKVFLKLQNDFEEISTFLTKIDKKIRNLQKKLGELEIKVTTEKYINQTPAEKKQIYRHKIETLKEELNEIRTIKEMSANFNLKRKY